GCGQNIHAYNDFYPGKGAGMMRAIRKLLVLFLIAVGSYHVLEEMSQWSNKTNEHLFRSLHKKEHKLESKVLSQNDSLFQWIGRAVDTLEEVYGEADQAFKRLWLYMV